MLQAIDPVLGNAEYSELAKDYPATLVHIMTAVALVKRVWARLQLLPRNLLMADPPSDGPR